MRVLYDRQLGLLLLDFKADFFEPRNTGSYETGKRQETARFDRRAWESARPDRPLNHANFTPDKSIERGKDFSPASLREKTRFISHLSRSASLAPPPPSPSPVVIRGSVEKFTTLAVVYT